MRFVSSLTLLSLAGLGLASPISARDDLATPNYDALGGLGGLTGGLGLRDEKKHGVSRRQTDGSSSSSSGDGHGVLLRSPQDDGSSGGGDGHGVLLRTRGEDEDDNQDEDEGEHEDKHKSKPKHKSKSESDAGEDGDDGDDKGKDKGKDKPKEKTKHKSKSKSKSKGKGKGDGKGKCNDARHTPACLAPADVDVLVNAYVRMLSKWNDTDAKYLADTFRDSSDSINILAGIPLGSATFPTKKAFIDHQHTQPDNLPLVVTHKAPYSCEEIALIWKATFGVAQKQVRGVTILGGIHEKGFWQIKSIDVEFNSIAYLLDIGGNYTLPKQ